MVCYLLTARGAHLPYFFTSISIYFRHLLHRRQFRRLPSPPPPSSLLLLRRSFFRRQPSSASFFLLWRCRHPLFLHRILRCRLRCLRLSSVFFASSAAFSASSLAVFASSAACAASSSIAFSLRSIFSCSIFFAAYGCSFCLLRRLLCRSYNDLLLCLLSSSSRPPPRLPLSSSSS